MKTIEFRQSKRTQLPATTKETLNKVRKALALLQIVITAKTITLTTANKTIPCSATPAINIGKKESLCLLIARPGDIDLSSFVG
jgi:hypothetical protein